MSSRELYTRGKIRIRTTQGECPPGTRALPLSPSHPTMALLHGTHRPPFQSGNPCYGTGVGQLLLDKERPSADRFSAVTQTEGTRSQTKSQEPRFACGSFFKRTARFHTASSTDWDERGRRAAQSHAHPPFMNAYELPSMEQTIHPHLVLHLFQRPHSPDLMVGASFLPVSRIFSLKCNFIPACAVVSHDASTTLKKVV